MFQTMESGAYEMKNSLDTEGVREDHSLPLAYTPKCTPN